MQIIEIKLNYNLIENFAIKIEHIISFEMFYALKEMKQAVDLFHFQLGLCIPIKNIKIKVIFFLLLDENK